MSKTDWNRCPTCRNLVDADDVVDGPEVRCRTCRVTLVVVERTDGTFGLTRYDDPDDASPTTEGTPAGLPAAAPGRLVAGLSSAQDARHVERAKNLFMALADSLDAVPDEDLLAESVAEGRDPKADAEALRAMLLGTVMASPPAGGDAMALLTKECERLAAEVIEARAERDKARENLAALRAQFEQVINGNAYVYTRAQLAADLAAERKNAARWRALLDNASPEDAAALGDVEQLHKAGRS